MRFVDGADAKARKAGVVVVVALGAKAAMSEDEVRSCRRAIFSFFFLFCQSSFVVFFLMSKVSVVQSIRKKSQFT